MIVAALDLFLGFPLFFAPGWANGWPSGLTIHAVWSAGMTLIIFVLLMGIAVGLGGFVGLACSLRGKAPRYAVSSYVVWLFLAAALNLILCVRVYQEIHAAALEMWPNGYPNRQSHVTGERC
jgi:hypothetical protein